jgi:hypothetical protein
VDGDAALTGAEAALGASEGAPPIPPIPPVLSATDLGVVGQHAGVRGRDGAISALVEGRSVWTFGDTPLTFANASGDTWVDNTLAWTSDLDASDGLTLEGNHLDAVGAPAEFIPYLPWERRYNERHDGDPCEEEPCGAEFAFWPGDIVPDPARGRALVFYYELWRVPGPEWETVGHSIAVWDGRRRVERPVLNPGSQTPTLMWERGEQAFTHAALVVADTLYAYGCKLHFLEHRCRVARVPLADALDKPAWRYYTGHGVWSADPARAVTVFSGGAAGTSVFYVPYLDAYMAIYNPAFDDDVRYRVSRTPWGPWSEPQYLFTTRPGWNGTSNYSAHAHPEFAEDDGRVQYVTYAHATGFLQSDLPLVRVEFGDPAN